MGMIVFIARFYGVIITGSIILLILKIIERHNEKKEENLDKYDKY